MAIVNEEVDGSCWPPPLIIGRCEIGVDTMGDATDATDRLVRENAEAQDDGRRMESSRARGK